VLLICAIGSLAIANSSKNASTRSTTSTTSATPQPGVTSTPALPASNHKIGDAVNFHNEWQVTINSASLSNGDANQVDPTPEAGKTYLIIGGTFKNLTTRAQTLSTLLYFELRDAEGNTYYEAFLPSVTPPDSSGVEAGGFVQGTWSYKVPTSLHAFALFFNSDLTGEPAIWDINV
jgi:hypothetical protein